MITDPDQGREDAPFGGRSPSANLNGANDAPEKPIDFLPFNKPVDFSDGEPPYMTAPSGARIYYGTQPPGLLGRGVTSPGRSAVDHANDLNDSIEGFHAGAQLSRDWAKILRQAKQAAAPGAAGFTRLVSAAFNDDVDRRSAAHGAAGQAILAGHATALRDWLVNEAVRFEAQAKGKKLRSDVEDTARMLAEAVQLASSLFGHGQAHLTKLAGRLPIEPSQQQGLLAQGLNQLAKGLIAGRIERDPNEAERQLQSGAHLPFLTTDDIADFRRQIQDRQKPPLANSGPVYQDRVATQPQLLTKAALTGGADHNSQIEQTAGAEASTRIAFEKTRNGMVQAPDGRRSSQHERDTLGEILDGLSKTEIQDPKGQSAGLFLRYYKSLVKAGISSETARTIVVAAIPRTQELIADAQAAGDPSSSQSGVTPAFVWVLPPIAELVLSAIFGVGAATIIAHNAQKDREGWKKWTGENNVPRAAAPPLSSPPGYPIPPDRKSGPLVTPYPKPMKPELPVDPPKVDLPNTMPGPNVNEPKVPNTWTEILPALEDALTRPLVAESRRGGENNRKVSAIVAEECVRALKETLGPVYEIDHWAGAAKDGEELKEKIIKPKNAKGDNLYLTNKDSVFPDISISIKDGDTLVRQIHLNVADLRARGGFTSREFNNFTRLEGLLGDIGDRIALKVSKYNLSANPELEYELRQEAYTACKDAVNDILRVEVHPK